MYRISSTNGFHDGRKFDSLGEAKQYADKHGNKCVMDVLALVDRETFRAVYTGGSNYTSVNQGTYSKNA